MQRTNISLYRLCDVCDEQKECTPIESKDSSRPYFYCSDCLRAYLDFYSDWIRSEGTPVLVSPRQSPVKVQL